MRAQTRLQSPGLAPWRWRLAALALAGCSLLDASGAAAANLTIADDVVVKFGQDAGLTVRDGMQTGRRNRFTSLKDDGALGQTGTSAQAGARGDWRGVKVEASVPAASLGLTDLSLRFAGGQGGAALDLRKNPFGLTSLRVSDSTVGLRLADGSAASFSGISLVNNLIGMEVERSATPSISGSEISGNALFGIENRTPASLVQAVGNWWGAASGPNDPVGNPGGAGDKVSAGVNYGPYTATVPLLGCTLAAADGNYIVSRPQVTLALSCRNGVEYRLAATTDFSGTAFAPMAAQAAFTLAAGSGTRPVYAEYRAATGNTLVVGLPQPFLLTQAPPTVDITHPTEGATLTGPVTVSVAAAAVAGIERVDIALDGAALATLHAAPYAYAWNIAAVADGTHTLSATAYDHAGQSARATRTVTVAKLPADTTGPAIGSPTFAGQPLASGDTLTAAGTLAFSLSDPSGVRSAQASIDGAAVAGGTLAAGRYSVPLDFNGIADGAHTLTLSATDLLANLSTASLNFTLAIPAPAAPVIASPSSGSTVRQPTVNVTGTTVPGAQVQVYLNGAPAGPAVAAGGTFAAAVTLAAEGSHTLTATAANSRGTSPPSAPVQLSYVAGAPTVAITSPAANATLAGPADIAITALDAAAIRSVVLAIDGTQVASFSAAPYTYRWDIAQAADGPHVLTAIATNQAGKTAQDVRSVTVQKAPPPPAPLVTPYTGAIASVTPASSYGEQPIAISGFARDRATGAAVPNAALRIVLQVAGFQRRFAVATDAAGGFSFNFVPQGTDGGNYVVSAIHPDETALANQGAFSINRLSFTPSVYNLNAAIGFPQPFQINAVAGAGQGASGVRFQFDAADQPSGSLPPGISVEPGAGINVPAGASVPVTLNFTGAGNAAPAGTIILTAYAGDSGGARRGSVAVNYRLATAAPALYAAPTYLQTGVSQGQMVTETLSIENKGLAAAAGLTVQLLNDDGSANLPSWIYLASAGQLGTLEVGRKQTVQVTAAPGAAVADGIYNFKLRVTAANAPAGDVPLSLSVTQAGSGAVRFKVADIYTNTLDTGGNPIPGLAGATLKVQNAEVLTVQQTAVSDAGGTATLTDLPTGSYVFRASAPNHADASGRFQVKPGATVVQNVFLDYNVVSIEFSVTETTLRDHYDINLTATYQTQVPAPVVLVEPLSINLPDMQVGEEITGELTITNYGLVRADGVVFTPPASDAFFKYEFYGTVPTSLAARQRLSLPYRITSLQALPDLPQRLRVAAARTERIRPRVTAAEAGTCRSYSAAAQLTYRYECANGDTRSGNAGSGYNKAYGTACGTGGGGGGGGVGGGGWGGGWGGGGWGGAGSSSPAPIPLTPQCTPNCDKCSCQVPRGPGGS